MSRSSSSNKRGHSATSSAKRRRSFATEGSSPYPGWSFTTTGVTESPTAERTYTFARSMSTNVHQASWGGVDLRVDTPRAESEKPNAGC